MFLASLEEYYPFCVTDLFRNSMMENPDFYKIWQEGMKKDGSSTAFLYMDELGVRLENDHITIRLGAGREYTDKYVKSKSGQRQGTVCSEQGKCRFIPGWNESMRKQRRGSLNIGIDSRRVKRTLQYAETIYRRIFFKQNTSDCGAGSYKN